MAVAGVRNLCRVDRLDVPLDRDIFLRTLPRHLSGTRQSVVGPEEAAGFVSGAGQEIGGRRCR